uniref:Uncharacterized protein n=1 Tax=Romanomermis culicivorax TaxID=13658 RepID=A0A915L4V6_ROMCU
MYHTYSQASVIFFTFQPCELCKNLRLFKPGTLLAIQSLISAKAKLLDGEDCMALVIHSAYVVFIFLAFGAKIAPLLHDMNQKDETLGKT